MLCFSFFVANTCICHKNGNSTALPRYTLSAWIRNRRDLMCHCLFNGHNSDTISIWSLIMLWTRCKISVCRCIRTIIFYHLSVDAFLRTLSTYFKDSVVILVFSTIFERAVKENLLLFLPSGKKRSVGNQFLLPNYTLSWRDS